MSTLTRINGGFAMAAVWLLFMAPSVSAKVVHHAPCAVLVLPEERAE